MLTPRQDKELDVREPDVRLCMHHIEVSELGDRTGPKLILMRLKGHMVMEGDGPDDDGELHIEDHRLFCLEVPMNKALWDNLRDSLNDFQDEVDRIVQDQNQHPQGYGRVDPEALAQFLGSIPDMFLRNPREDDEK